MAIVHKASLSPSKVELISSWLPSRPWYRGTATDELKQVAAFRFDDPAGEVGLQVLLVAASDTGPIYQVPMTYRAAPLHGADDALMGEMAHSVLGPRYVYDACHDPVFVSELVRAVLTGGTEVDEVAEVDGQTITLPKSMNVHGTGTDAHAAPVVDVVDVRSTGDDHSVAAIRSGAFVITLPRVLAADMDPMGAPTLIGSWPGAEPTCLAFVTSQETPKQG
ncbi:MAG TPA: hypothetical protein VGM78_16560 [Ilumatobacteraceae bacterium]